MADIKKYIPKLGLPSQRPRALERSFTDVLREYCPDGHAITTDNLVESCRIAWLAVLEKNPGISDKLLQHRFSILHKWLYTNDHQWLSEHQSSPDRGSLRFRRLSEIDGEIASEIIAVCFEFLARTDYPIQITQTRLLNAVGRTVSYYRQRRELLPITFVIIDAAIETKVEFIVRRVAWLGRSYGNKDLPPMSEFVDRHHLAGYQLTPEVKAALQEVYLRRGSDSPEAS